MSHFDKAAVRDALRAEDVAAHLGIEGQWRGRWMRSATCGRQTHGSHAFGLARDGMWHCWSCDEGGDLLDLLASSLDFDIKRGIDREDFGKVLELGAAIAGVQAEDDFAPPEKPAPRKVEAPPLPPLKDRIALAKRRAAWTWDRLYADPATIALYLRTRHLTDAQIDLVMTRENLAITPLKVQQPATDASPDLVTLWRTMKTLAMVIPVRAVDDGRLIDLRARRFDPKPQQPKIIGMVGGLTAAPAEKGRPRELLGCYGKPHQIDADHVVVVEGGMDYLTALAVFPDAQVVGAVEAGSLNLVARHVAKQLAARDETSRITIVEQNDPARQLKDGRWVSGAADAAINEDPVAATKTAVQNLGARRVGWLLCSAEQARMPGNPIKDLNDLVKYGANIAGMLTWWTDLASEPW